MKRLRLVVSGDVTGVGYRSWFRHQAVALGISGWVRNREDGSVEALVSGDEASVATIVSKARTGPMTSMVRDVAVWEADSNEPLEGFRVVY